MPNQSEEKLKPIENEHIIRSGRLKVGDGHELYWVDWGNKDIKEPVFYLHGGPGGGFDEKDFNRFDPKKHRVVLHDQRGSGRSTPFASIQHNTSQDLVSDITKLKNELGFDKISLYGFSWGSTLSLLYAMANPAVISKMLIGGIFLARKADNDFYLRGLIASHFPEVWERFTAIVPENERTNISQYYKSQMFGQNDDAKKRFAKEWMVYESSILKLDYVPANVERELKDFASESLAYLEAHYILQDCFIEEDYILKHAGKLKNIPTVIVHGRYDFICMPSAAYELAQALGEKALLHFVMAGHSTGDTVQREVVRAYANMLWQ
ncbi:MAG TPA: prolyl aminopeptidase [Candidatus Saccharimonadales bacterium]|nr:prolyl aminopeptidase [Candidatus Saccharimonadales bacterium]